MSNKTGIDFNLERKQSTLLYDTRRLSEKLRGSLAGEVPVVVMAGLGGGLFFASSFAEIIFLFGILFFFYVRTIQKGAGLALRMPKTSGMLDPKELSLKDGKPILSEGIIYLGNDMDTDEEVWLTDIQARTHMLFMGTTGSGKTEFLISLVYNSLIHGSGFIYVDGKADSSLYGKIYSMARAMGREDDVLVINFQTGAKDIYGAQPNKLSNTLNPFAVGSSGMLSELVKGLMATGEKSTWTQQAESFVEALMKPLVYLRDNHGMDLDVSVIRGYFGLNELEDLAWRAGDKYPGLIESGVLAGLHNYLLTKPAYQREKYHDQSDTTLEQHGYISMQLIRTFNSLSDTYGYIMKTPLAEIDFVDVFLNRRILVVLLPALEKAPSELTNLGRIVVASIKSTMAKGLGSTLEGSWKKVIASKPTTAPSPFMCVLDEYGYYAVEGFSVVPAQARSLGFSAIFAGQDLPAFEKASKEEAKSTLANTNTRLCGKLECTQTFEFFKNIAGSGSFTKISRFERDSESLVGSDFKTDNGISIDKLERVSFEALRGQLSGQWHLFFANTILRLKSFYSNPKPVKNLRVNHFIKVARPDAEEIKAFKNTYELFTRAVTSEGGLMSFMDRVSSPSDIADIHEGFDLFKLDSALLQAGKTLAYCAQAEDRRSSAFTAMTLNRFNSEPEQLDSAVPFDFAAHMGGDDSVDESDTTGSLEAGFPRQTRKSESIDGSESKLFEDDPYIIRPTKNSQSQNLDPDDLLFGIPDDVVNETRIDDNWEDSQEVEENNLAGIRSKMLPLKDQEGTQFFGQTSAFGVENYAIPKEIDNDVAVDAADRPIDLNQVGEVEYFETVADEFDSPLAGGGLLSREATVSGVAAIEMAIGSPVTESMMTASAVAESIACATTYPMTPPSTLPDIEQFESIARRLSHVLSVAADQDE